MQRQKKLSINARALQPSNLRATEERKWRLCKLPLPVRVGLTRKARLSRRHAPRERVVVLYSWCKRNLFTRLCCKYNGVRVSRVPVHKELVNFLCCVLFTAVESLCKQLDAISVCTIRKITDGYVKQDCACTHLLHRLGLISLVPLAADWNSANWCLFFIRIFLFKMKGDFTRTFARALWVRHLFCG